MSKGDGCGSDPCPLYSLRTGARLSCADGLSIMAKYEDVEYVTRPCLFADHNVISLHRRVRDDMLALEPDYRRSGATRPDREPYHFDEVCQDPLQPSPRQPAAHMITYAGILAPLLQQFLSGKSCALILTGHNRSGISKALWESTDENPGYLVLILEALFTHLLDAPSDSIHLCLYSVGSSFVYDCLQGEAVQLDSEGRPIGAGSKDLASEDGLINPFVKFLYQRASSAPEKGHRVVRLTLRPRNHHQRSRSLIIVEACTSTDQPPGLRQQLSALYSLILSSRFSRRNSLLTMLLTEVLGKQYRERSCVAILAHVLDSELFASKSIPVLTTLEKISDEATGCGTELCLMDTPTSISSALEEHRSSFCSKWEQEQTELLHDSWHSIRTILREPPATPVVRTPGCGHKTFTPKPVLPSFKPVG